MGLYLPKNALMNPRGTESSEHKKTLNVPDCNNNSDVSMLTVQFVHIDFLHIPNVDVKFPM